MSKPSELLTAVMALREVPSLWRIERCEKHDDWVSNCLRCQEEVLTVRTENAYRAGHKAALEQALPDLEKLLAEARLEEAEWWNNGGEFQYDIDADKRLADLRRAAGAKP